MWYLYLLIYMIMKNIIVKTSNTTRTVSSNANPLYVKLGTIVPLSWEDNKALSNKQARVFINQRWVFKASSPVWVIHSLNNPAAKKYKKKYVFFNSAKEKLFTVYDLTVAKNRILELFAEQKMAAIRKASVAREQQTSLQDIVISREETLNSDIPC